MSKYKHHFAILSVASAMQMHAASAEVLWDNWYTVSDHGHPSYYYNEKAEISGDKAKIQVNTWIKDGQKVRSEALGEVSKNTQLLEPLLFDFRTQTPDGMDKVVDGSFSGKSFSVKIKTGIQQSKPLRAEMVPKLILASSFPLWLNKNYKRVNGVQPIEFTAILEDQVENQVPVATGTAYEMNPDEFAKATKTRKLRIEFNKVVAIWWVTPKGDAVQIEVKAMEQSVKKVDRKTAEAFLSNP